MQDLALHHYQIDLNCSGAEVAQAFNQDAHLPGVIFLENGDFAGMLSRRRFLEFMSRPYGLELFSKRSLKVLYDFAKINLLMLPGDMPIPTATRMSLQRSSELIDEPIVVKIDDYNYRLLDVHQLLVANSQIHELTTQLLNQQTQAKLIQTEKMASLGEMIAGIAHEILNPVNFIWGNIDYLANYGQDLMQVLDAYTCTFPQSDPEIEALKAEVEFDFVLKDFPQVIASMRMGAERLRRIIAALRTFSHVDEDNQRPLDIHDCLDNTLLILNNRLKNAVQVIKQYGSIPMVNGYSGQLSQVFMNLIGNAIDALMAVSASSREPGWQAQIAIASQIQKTGDGNSWVQVNISDNGMGMSEEVQARIFETFFTTKPPGKGTGLGLAITHQIVTEKHHGQINVRSQVGQGTTFEVLLPLA